jgi:hypothetical protein
MIDQDTFLAGFSALTEWFGVTLPDPIVLRYQQQLQTLSNRDFNLSIDKLIADRPPRSDRFPSIREIIEAIRVTPGEIALLEWEKITRYINLRHQQDEVLELTEQGQRALALVGGIEAVSECTISQIGFLRRDFLNYHGLLRRVASLRREDNRALQSRSGKSKTDWANHPDRVAWIADIQAKGVPSFIGGMGGDQEYSEQRAEFYQYAKTAGWLDLDASDDMNVRSLSID